MTSRDITRRNGTSYISTTNIRTEDIAELAEAGWTYQQIISHYPSMTGGRIKAAYRYERTARRRLERAIRRGRVRLGCWFLGMDRDEMEGSGL